MGLLTFSLCLRSGAFRSAHIVRDLIWYWQKTVHSEDLSFGNPNVARITGPAYRASQLAIVKQNFWVFWFGWFCILSFTLTHWCNNEGPACVLLQIAILSFLASVLLYLAFLGTIHIKRCTWAAPYLVMDCQEAPSSLTSSTMQQAWVDIGS